VGHFGNVGLVREPAVLHVLPRLRHGWQTTLFLEWVHRSWAVRQYQIGRQVDKFSPRSRGRDLDRLRPSKIDPYISLLCPA
jgi:hypothetical protein